MLRTRNTWLHGLMNVKKCTPHASSLLVKHTEFVRRRNQSSVGLRDCLLPKSFIRNKKAGSAVYVIDETVIAHMSDDDLEKVGVRKYGDRIAIFTYVKTQSCENSVIDRIRTKLMRRKQSWKGLRGNQNATKSKRKVEIGWKNEHEESNVMKQVRQQTGGGTRSVQIEVDSKFKEILPLAKELFFPDGKSQNGKEEDFNFFLQLFDGTDVDMNKTVHEVYSEKGIKVLRIYLCTSRKDKVQSTCTTRKHETQPSKKVKFEPSTSNIECPSGRTESKSLCIELPDLTQYSDLMQFESPQANLCSTPENETQPCEKVKLKPISSNVEYLSEDIESTSLCTDSYNFPHCNNFMQFESPPVNSHHEESVVFAPCDDTLADTLPLQNLNIRVHRGRVLKDLMDIFKTADVPCLRGAVVHVTMILPNGEEEIGEDGGGVFRDMISECFDDIYETLTTGNIIKVPNLHPKMGAKEWEAIGSILELAYSQQRMFPIRLSPSFLQSAMTGEEVDKMSLLDEYVQFLPQSESDLISKAFLSYDDIDQDELVDFCNDHHHTSVPACEQSFRKMVADIAHKELIQEPEYVAKQWRPKLKNIQPQLPGNKFDFSALIPTFKNVWSSIQFSDTVLQPHKNMLRRFLKDNESLLGNFLRFCTGSNVFLNKKISVSFGPYSSEILRIPVGHTCGCTLEIPAYTEYSDMKIEFSSVLRSNVWVMDIL